MAKWKRKRNRTRRERDNAKSGGKGFKKDRKRERRRERERAEKRGIQSMREIGRTVCNRGSRKREENSIGVAKRDGKASE